MDQNFNYNKAQYRSNPPYTYKEYWIDPSMGRPWTYLEERFMRRFVKEPSGLALSNFIWSERLQLFWPEFIAKKIAASLAKAGYLTVNSQKRSHELYQLTNFGQCMVSKKRACEM